MIELRLRDGGTRARISASGLPGLDELAWIEVNYEGDRTDDPGTRGNEGMKNTTPVTLSPWPYPMSQHAWLDRTPRHDGITIGLYTLDQATDSAVLVPSGLTQFWDDAVDPTDQGAVVHQRIASMSEVQDSAETPADWLHYPIDNTTGGTGLKDELRLVWDGRAGGRHRLVIPDNDLWVPFDSTESDRYDVFMDGEPVDFSRFSVGDTGRYILHLRPRKWFHSILMVAHFAYVTMFEFIPDDQYFITSYYNRPPFYPYRHDVRHAVAVVPDFFGILHAVDIGLDWQWDHSQASYRMRQEVLNAVTLGSGLSIAYIFLGNEMPTDDVFREPPRPGEYVAGLTMLDGNDAGKTVFLRQSANLDAVYPRTLINQFIYQWWV